MPAGTRRPGRWPARLPTISPEGGLSGTLWLSPGSVGGEAVSVADRQDVEDGLPAVDPSSRVRPVRSAFAGDEVEDLQGGLLGGEVSAPAHGLPEPGVE